MRICDFKIFHYKIPLSRQLSVGKATLTNREGFIIKLSDENGNYGLGETAPLEGISVEMPDIVLAQLKSLRQKISGQSIPQNIEKNNCKFSAWLENMPLASSVHFGFESAVLSLKAAALKKSVAHLFSENYQSTIVINGLLQGNRESILKEAERLLRLGYKTLKLKVATRGLSEDIATCNALTSLMAGRAILRLDANKAWDFKDAVEFCKSIDFASVEYIEEPLKDFSETGKFYEETLIPVAVDESLKEHSLREIKSIDGVEIVILKPTILGGFEKISRLAQEAHCYGLHTVITSTFESGIGLRALANLAACFSKHIAVGLDTAKWFKTDTVLSPFCPLKGRINVDDCQLDNLQLDFKTLTEVP